MAEKRMNLEEAKKDPNMPLKIAKLLYELYADQYGLTLESITVRDKKEGSA